jgi:endonuclease/exonuclease/phosphatase family metal-dependent hydrolase
MWKHNNFCFDFDNAFGKLQDYADKFENRPVKIDYVFTNLPTDHDESYAVEDIPVDGIYISDHRPVVAFVEI